jgi:magnesium-transporting ATPase (P-type)
MRLASPQESRTEHGLTAAEAARHLTEFGPNLIESGSRFRLLWTGVGLLANPLVVILLVASIVSGVVGETLSAVIIVSIVLLSVALDFFQSFRSEKAASSLQSLLTLTASVWRDGKLAEVPVRDVVPGDLLQLRAGDLVPADATLLSAVTLSVDQAALTGESLPVQKYVGDGGNGELFAGTSIVSGVGQSHVRVTVVHMPAINTPQFGWCKVVCRARLSLCRPFSSRRCAQKRCTGPPTSGPRALRRLADGTGHLGPASRARTRRSPGGTHGVGWSDVQRSG